MTALFAIGWPLLKTFWKPLALIFAVLAIFLYGFHKGDARRDRIWTARIEAEKEKQAQIVFKADNEALAATRKLEEELEISNAQINELLIEAEKDTNAVRPALGVDSLRRINRGRANQPR